MAVVNRGRTELCSSPERTKTTKKKASVVYYLSRNGQLEQPHFMEVTLSSRDGLYLKDVTDRLNFLRGNGLASSYSWSSKRSYKNGFVWHDLSEEDFILPAHGEEYVLKGSELLRSSSSPAETTDPERSDFPPERRKKTAPPPAPASASSSVDFGEYKVYRNKLMDAATQTGDDRRRRRRRGVIGEGEEDGENRGEEDNPTTELSGGEISPPPSSSSTETLESLIKADGGVVVASTGGGGGGEIDRSVAGCPSGRFRASASAVLMNLISCGSISVKDHGGAGGGGGGGGLPPRGRPAEHQEETKEMDGAIETPSFSSITLENKEYFSGSLIETKKRTAAGDGTAAAAAAAMGLKRSSSYNAERGSKMEMDGCRGARCIPAGKAKSTAKESGKMEGETK